MLSANFKVKLNMESTRIDVDEKKMPKSALKNGRKVEFVEKSKKVDKPFSPLFHQVSCSATRIFPIHFEHSKIKKPQQLLGCSSPLLSVVALGNVIGYSSILLPQLAHKDHSIEINSSEASWIGEIRSNESFFHSKIHHFFFFNLF